MSEYNHCLMDFLMAQLGNNSSTFEDISAGVKDWLEEYKKEIAQLPTVDDITIEYRDAQMVLIDKQISALTTEKKEPQK